jgi:type IV secretion system protein VirD4
MHLLLADLPRILSMRRSGRTLRRRFATLAAEESDMMDSNELGQPILGWRVDQSGQKHFEFLGPEDHVVTIAPTGAGKGTCVLIPALLRYPGQCIVMDAKGEAARITSERRRTMGQAVYVLDPFGDTGMPSARLNPFDLVRNSERAIDGVGMLLDVLIDIDQADCRDPFWRQSASALLKALLVHLMETTPAHEWDIARWLKLFPVGDKRTTSLAEQMAESPHPMVRAQARVIREFMQEHETARDIVSHASTMIAPLRGNVVAAATRSTDIDLEALQRGDALTIYLVIPPNRLDTARPLLRTWLMTLSTVLLKRTVRPEHSTLLLIDEAAQMGRMELMLQAMTLLRGYGLQCWSFWQDLSQLQGVYPETWQTILSNTSAIQMFGFPSTTEYVEANHASSLEEPQTPMTLVRRTAGQESLRLTPFYSR